VTVDRWSAAQLDAFERDGFFPVVWTRDGDRTEWLMHDQHVAVRVP